jgi:hypothetical protein
MWKIDKYTIMKIFMEFTLQKIMAFQSQLDQSVHIDQKVY